MTAYRLRALAGEPWCFAPPALAALTDGQIDDLYFAPRDDDGRLVAPADRVAPDAALPDREAFAADAMDRFGNTRDHWLGQYDIWAAQMAAAGSDN